MRTSTVEVTIEVRQDIPPADGQAHASIKFNGITVYEDFVYDNEIASAETNILRIFGSRLWSLLGPA